MGVLIALDRQKQYFNAAHTIDLGLNDNQDQRVTIFGVELQSNQHARALYGSIPCFTYQEGLHFNNTSLTSDVGWGCMLRVGQMALAEALRRTQGIEHYGDPDTLARVIEQFSLYYSLQTMVKAGEQLFKKTAGSWFTPSETAQILKQLINQNVSSPLRVLIYNNEFEVASAIEYLQCGNWDKNNEVSRSQLRKKKGQTDSRQRIATFPGLIIVLVRLGMTTPQPEMLKSVLEVMKLPSFMGILGGRPGKAHYIVGFTATSFIYLDPHCVKNPRTPEDFLNDTIFSMAHQKVDSSMGLCFFAGDYVELMMLYDGLSLLKNEAFYSYSVVEPASLLQVEPAEHYELLVPEELPSIP